MGTKKNRHELLDAITVASTAGITLFVCIAIGLWLGYKVDQYISQATPWGLIVGGLIGAIAGFWGLCKQILKND